MTLSDRLDALKSEGVIAGWQPRGATTNVGLGGELPAVIMPANEGPASTFANDVDLEEAVEALERFGPMAVHNGSLNAQLFGGQWVPRSERPFCQLPSQN